MVKKAAEIAVKAIPKVPKLTKSTSYKSFLNTVISARENKKILGSHGKSVVDMEYKRLLTDLYRHDDGKANELFKEVGVLKSKTSIVTN